MGVYVLMEKYYMRESIQKAIEMDNQPENGLASSMIDDTFYVLKVWFCHNCFVILLELLIKAKNERNLVIVL